MRRFETYRAKTWLLVAVALVCLVLLFVGGPQDHLQRSYSGLWGLGHILCFAVWSRLFLIWRHNCPPVRLIFTVVGLTLLLGFGIEIIQLGLGRNFDLVDVLSNLAGSLLVLSFFSPGRLALSRSRRVQLQLITLLVLSVAISPLARTLYDEHLARKNFPVLSDLETPFELDRWEGNAKLLISRDFVSQGVFSLKAELTMDRYSGLFLTYFPRDWGEFKRLRFDLYNPDQTPLRVTCRIHDRDHVRNGYLYRDRFHKDFVLQPGWTEIEIRLEEVTTAPEDRFLDLKEVAAVGIFVSQEETPKVLYLDNMRLAR